ncbi:hypothetical protein GCM10027053_21290 [Intrasporangium mesophilum]
MTVDAFEEWTMKELGLTEEEIDAMKLPPVFDLFISRIEAARARGAVDPLQTVTAKLAGGNSRACTRRMLEQLRYTAAQRRAVHRLLAGSPSGWPGLLRLYVEGLSLTGKERQYARRQVQILLGQTTGSRSNASAACSAIAVTP